MFIKHNIDASASPGPSDDYWYMPVGISVAAGVRVSPENSMRLTAVYACVRVIAETVAQLPLILYRRVGDNKQRAIHHPLYKILHMRPNSWQTSFEWREMMQGHVTLRGNAYSEILFSRSGDVLELIPLQPDRVRIEPLNDSYTNFRYVYKDMNGTERRISRTSMFHLKGLSSNGVTGINPIEAEAESIGVGLAAQEYAARFFSNNGSPGGWIEHPGNFKDTDKRRDFIESWRQQQTGSNRHKTAVLEYGMKYHEMTVNNKDMQFLESRKYQDGDIARIFRVPPHKIGLLDRATFSNIEHQGLEFVTDTMMPWLVRWEQAISRDLITDDDQYFAEYLVDSLMRGDTQSRYNAYSVAINSGFMTRNEARQKENMDTLDGLDRPLTPMNMQSDERSQKLKENAAATIVKKEVMAMQRVYDDAIASMKPTIEPQVTDFFNEKHVQLVVDRMAIGIESARQYVYNSRDELLNALTEEINTKKPVIKDLLQNWQENKSNQLANIED